MKLESELSALPPTVVRPKVAVVPLGGGGVGVGVGVIDAATLYEVDESAEIFPEVSLHFTYVVYEEPLVSPVIVVECDVPPVVEKVFIVANALPAVLLHAQVAASLVVTESVVCVVPAASVPVGAVMVMVGGVVSVGSGVGVGVGDGGGGGGVTLPQEVFPR